jgi:hypothetical protein
MTFGSLTTAGARSAGFISFIASRKFRFKFKFKGNISSGTGTLTLYTSRDKSVNSTIVTLIPAGNVVGEYISPVLPAGQTYLSFAYVAGSTPSGTTLVVDSFELLSAEEIQIVNDEFTTYGQTNIVPDWVVAAPGTSTAQCVASDTDAPGLMTIHTEVGNNTYTVVRKPLANARRAQNFLFETRCRREGASIVGSPPANRQIGLFGGNNTNPPDIYAAFVIQNSTGLRICYRDSSDTVINGTAGTGIDLTTAWQRLTIVGNTTDVRYYVDGILQFTIAASSLQFDLSLFPAVVGLSPVGTSPDCGMSFDYITLQIDKKS